MASPTIWRTAVLTLFPEMFPGPLGVSLAGKALSAGLWELEARDIRDSATDRHRSVDDTPAGGGPGMVLRADVLAAAIDATDAVPGSATDRPRLLNRSTLILRAAPRCIARESDQALRAVVRHRPCSFPR